MSLLPPQSTNSQTAHSTFRAGKWKAYIMPMIMAGFLLQLLFLGNMSYLFGALFKSTTRMHNLKILAIDFDGGDIGKAISSAYSNLKSDEFPSLEFGSSLEYRTPESVRVAVCDRGYWGAIYTHSGASERLLTAIEGDNTAAYNPSDAVTYIFNGAHYPAVASSLKGSLQTLLSVASKLYPLASPDAVKAVNMTNPMSAGALLNPFEGTAWDIMPTNQGTRVLLNTVSMVMPILMQFFFQMAMNGIMGNAKVLETQSKRDIYVFRLGSGKIYTFISALVTTGYFWAFREGWSVTFGQFFETWMCIWLYMDINYLLLDTVMGTVIPMQFLSFFVLTWVIVNIASTVYPFDLTPGFYHWSWALPAHDIWLLLVEIWSGCRSSLDKTLPILFAWWLVVHFSSAWSVRRRCLMAEVEAQRARPTGDKFTQYTTAQSQQSVLERMSTRASGQAAKERSSDNYDLEAYRLGESLPNGDASRTTTNAPLSTG